MRVGQLSTVLDFNLNIMDTQRTQYMPPPPPPSISQSNSHMIPLPPPPPRHPPAQPRFQFRPHPRLTRSRLPLQHISLVASHLDQGLESHRCSTVPVTMVT